jgi:hypothetical protein
MEADCKNSKMTKYRIRQSATPTTFSKEDHSKFPYSSSTLTEDIAMAMAFIVVVSKNAVYRDNHF